VTALAVDPLIVVPVGFREGARKEDRVFVAILSHRAGISR
jgi:hypothetical protein